MANGIFRFGFGCGICAYLPFSSDYIYDKMLKECSSLLMRYTFQCHSNDKKKNRKKEREKGRNRNSRWKKMPYANILALFVQHFQVENSMAKMVVQHIRSLKTLLYIWNDDDTVRWNITYGKTVEHLFTEW